MTKTTCMRTRDYKSRTYRQVQKEARGLGLKTTGTKQQICNRITSKKRRQRRNRYNFVVLENRLASIPSVEQPVQTAQQLAEYSRLNMECNVCNEERTELQTQQQQILRQLKECDVARQQCIERQSQIEKEYQAYKNQVNSSRSEADKVNAELKAQQQQLQQRIELLKAELEASKKEVVTLTNRLSELGDERQINQAFVRTANRQLESATDKYTKLEQEYATLKEQMSDTNNRQNELNKFKVLVDKMKSDYQALEQQYINLKASKASLNFAMEESKKQLSDCSSKLREAETKLQQSEELVRRIGERIVATSGHLTWENILQEM